jgi:hypothetical protein
MNISKLIVNVAAHKKSYMLKFAKNEELIAKIKQQENTKWDTTTYSWILGPKALIKVINLYKGRSDIFFNFTIDGLREKFIQDIAKEAKKEAEELLKNGAKLEEYKRHKALKEHLETVADTLTLPEGVFVDWFKPYPHQLVAAHFLNEIKTGMLLLDMGLGKAQPLSSPILTPTGWVKMGDIQLGDKVINSSGGVSNVTGVFPQGKKAIYRLTFSDESTAESCAEHLWTVNSATGKKRGYSNKTFSLKELMDAGLQYGNGNNKWYIPIVKPVEFEGDSSLPLDPYLLGCLLGDGCLGELSVNMTCHDYEIINELKQRLPANTKINNPNGYDYSFVRVDKRGQSKLLIHLRELGVANLLSYYKFIPEIYLYSTIENRIEILQGLLDTDGSVYKDGTIQYFTVSPKLMEGVKHIVQSLGGVCRVKTKQGRYKKDGEYVNCQMCYVMTINLPQEVIPFKLTRKVEKLKKVKKYHPSRAIVKAEFIGEMEAQCISVDAKDNLYITNNFVVTHNTLISIMFTEMQGDKFKKVLVVTPNSLKYNYKNEVEKFTNSKAYVYQGLVSKKGIAAELEGVKEAKYIIVNYEYFNAKPVPATKSERKDNVRYFDKKKKFDNIGLPVKSIDCVICDESHKLKNEEANTTRNFIRTLGKKDHIILMTGTPAPSRIEELFTALHMIAPTLIKTKSDYYRNFCGLRNDEGTFGWVQDSAPKLKEIYELMSPFSIRKRKEDVLKHLPEKQVTRIVIELTASDLKAYEEVEKGVAFEMFGELKKGNSINAMTTLLRLRQFTSMLKVKYMKEIFDRLVDENEKFVVFDASVETLKVMHEQYKDLSVLHIGDIDTLTRSELVNVFQEDDSCLIFFGSNATCNAGLTLTAASKLFQMQQPYTVGENDQLNDRIHRIGQKNFCNIYIPILKDTIDEMVFYLVEGKKKNLSLAIDNIEYDKNRNQMFVNDLITKFKQKYKGLD